MNKTFRIVSVSTKPNAFGLHGHILVARDGTAFEVARSRGSWNNPWNKGADVVVPYITDEGSPCRPSWASVACEVPRALESCPENCLKEIYGSSFNLSIVKT